MALLIKMNILKRNIENIKIRKMCFHNTISQYGHLACYVCNMERSIDNLVNFEKVISKN